MSTDQSEDECLLENNHSDDYKEILEELEERSKYLCTELEERLVVLTTSLKTLKETIKKEKQLWRNELQNTIELEKTMSENFHQSGDYNQHFEMLINAFLKSQTKIQNKIHSNLYKQQLAEAENMCSLEMLKIRKSLECLAPLQAIVNDWSAESEEAKS